MAKFTLGQVAKDKITGFEGVLTGRAEYLTGCDQYIIQPECVTKGTYQEGRWFDEGRLEIIDGKGISADDVQGEKNGCDYSAPVK